MPEQSKKALGFFKTLWIYLFLLFSAYVVADIVLLKYLRPQFLPEVTKKDVADLNLSQEKETGPYMGSEIASKSFYLDEVLERNIFNFGEMPVPLSQLQESDEEEEFEDNIPVKTGLPLTLEGTAVHRNPFKSIATIKGQGETKSYTVGDQIENLAKVISVLRKKVIFRNLDNKRLEYVEIDRDQIQASRPSRPRVSPRPSRPQPESEGSIRQEGNTFYADREDVNNYLSDYRSLLSQANSRPVKDPATGEMLGYEVFAIRPGSVFEQLGLKNGDVISEVNGTKVTNPGQAMSMFGKLKSANEINISINRNGRSEELEYRIEE